MSDVREQLAEHLRFYGELGVAGFRREPDWNSRPGTNGPRAERANVELAFRPAEADRADRADLKVGSTTEAQMTIDHRPSAIDDRPSAIDDRPSTIDHRPSTIDDRRSTIDHRPSTIDYLASIRTDIGDCTRCKLCKLGRRQIVFGVGNPKADLMFVGEAPGRDEDVQGVPFVGRAGQKLTQIIEAIGLKREDVYIANVIKCRPPENRNPEPDEVEVCEQFLFRQVDVIAPKVIVALGTFAARSLLKSDAPISRLRGRVYDYRGAQLIPTFHPAYLLRNPSCRREVWEDMKKARALLTGED